MRVSRRSLFASSLAAATTTPLGAACAQDAPISPLQRPLSGDIKVAVLTDERTNIMDLACAWEPLSVAGSEQQHFELYSVSPRPDAINIGGGTGIAGRASYGLENAPRPHVIVIGAQTGDTDEGPTTAAKSEWLRQMAPEADVVMSICTGAFVLARAGLLDGLSTTTHHLFYESFESQFSPRVNLIRNRRFVDNGKFVSAGGLTSGIDATLHVIARFYGAEQANAVADYLEHYSNDWRTGVPVRPA
jgi:transcriptional regulator GlxA family with amidase domain